MRGRDLLLLAALAFSLRAFAIWAVPLAAQAERIECAPDEAGHFWVANEWAHGRAPTWPESSWTIKGSFPPTQYAAQAATVALTRVGLDPDWLYRFPIQVDAVRGYPMARFGSALLGVATVLLLACAAWIWTGSSAAGRAVGLMAAVYPQLIFIGSYSNGDAMTVFAGAVVAWGLARWVRAGEGEHGLAWVGIGSALVLMGKPTGFGILPATGFWLFWAWWRGRIGVRAICVATLSGLVVCGPLLAWNAWRNGGDPLGLWLYGDYVKTAYEARAGDVIPNAEGTFAYLFPASAFGVFRNVDLPLPMPLLAAALVLLVVGLVRATSSLTGAEPATRRGAAWLAASVVITVSLAAWNAWFVDFQPQGRYALLCAILLTAVAVCGPQGARFERGWLRLYLGFLAVCALWTEWILYANPCA
ncbi:MAG: glycosyltransferase family 39 protein [Candidatus Binatia bacterium]|nr:glycosyltransferase family 39 protein [Candidatus Binatia bacterium]